MTHNNMMKPSDLRTFGQNSFSWLQTEYRHSFFKHRLNQQDEGWHDSKVGRLQRLEKNIGFWGLGHRETIGSSTCGSPTITPVDAPAANSASKLNKDKGTSGLVPYLSKSTAWMQDSGCSFWTTEVLPGYKHSRCKHRLGLRILCSGDILCANTMKTAAAHRTWKSAEGGLHKRLHEPVGSSTCGSPATNYFE